jgi:hypothetical protein
LRWKVLDKTAALVYAWFMAARPLRKHTEPIPLHEHALDNLRYIRDTMERAGAFTAVPGWGGVAMGMTALAAAWIAGLQQTTEGWLRVWLIEAVAGILTGAIFMVRKARLTNLPLWSTPARKFALSFSPPLLVASALTFVLASAQAAWVIPGVWLCLYGTAVMAAGAFSVRIVPVMGMAFIATGCASFLSPQGWGDVWLAFGFGGLHVVFGVAIARRYGG